MIRSLPIVLAVLLAAGCTATGDEGGGDTGTGGTGPITFATGRDTTAYLQPLLDRWNQAHPAEKVTLLELPEAADEQRAQMVANLQARSNRYDVLGLDVVWTAEFAENGWIIPLERGLFPLDRLLPSVVDTAVYKNKLWAVPYTSNAGLLYYRTDLINKLLSDPTQKATYEKISKKVVGQTLEPKKPADWNWNDYIATAAFFSKKYNSASPTKYGTALQAKNLVYNTMIWDDVLWSFGGNWLDSSGKPDLESKAAKSAMEVYNKIYTAGLTSPDSSQAEFPETQAALTSGNAAFAVQWSAGYADLNNPAKSPATAGKIGVAPVPGDQHKTHVHALAVAINKYGKNQKAATKWLTYLGTSGAMTDYAKSGGIPAMPSVLTAQSKVNPIYRYVVRDLPTDGFAEPALPKSFDISTMLAQELSGAWVGQKSIDSALKKANSDLAGLAGQ